MAPPGPSSPRSATGPIDFGASEQTYCIADEYGGKLIFRLKNTRQMIKTWLTSHGWFIQYVGDVLFNTFDGGLKQSVHGVGLQPQHSLLRPADILIVVATYCCFNGAVLFTPTLVVNYYIEVCNVLIAKITWNLQKPKKYKNSFSIYYLFSSLCQYCVNYYIKVVFKLLR